MRDGWLETDDYLLIDCGALGALSGGHAHADALAIDLAAGGRTLLADAGTYTYHETKELRDYFRSSEAHNTLVIDEKSSSETDGKFSWKTKAEAKLSAWISQPRFDFFEGSHNGFQRLKDSPATHTRSILFLKNDYWLMRDYVETLGEHDYKLNFQFTADTNPSVEQAQNGDFCVSEMPDSEVGLRLFTFGDMRRSCVSFQADAVRRNFLPLCCRAPPPVFSTRRKFLKPKSAADALLSLIIAVIRIYSFSRMPTKSFALNFLTRIFAFYGRV